MIGLQRRRRGMMGGEKQTKTLYLFQNGSYGDWLNGQTVQAVTAGTHGNPSYSISIEESNLNLVATQGTYNRVANYVFGIELPSGFRIKNIGIKCTNSSTSQFAFGVSETLIAKTGGTAGAVVTTGLGEYSWKTEGNGSIEDNMIPAGNTSGKQNYVVVWIQKRKSSSSSDAVSGSSKISELWIEVEI